MKKILFPLLYGVSCCMGQAPYPASPPTAARLTKAEYFFDTDPCIGQATTFALTPATDINSLSQTVSLSGPALSSGFHRLYLRTMDESGKWSLTANSFFDNYAVPAYAVMPQPVANVVEAEYFIDTDPGLGLGRKIPLSPDTGVTVFNYAVNITGLTVGVHRLYVRTKNTAGKWSLTYFGLFDNSASPPYPTATAVPAAISRLEYYLDSDPGFGNGQSVAIGNGTDLPNVSFDVPVSSLSPGKHTLYVRSKSNPWSMCAYADFQVGVILPLQWVLVKARAVQQTAHIIWVTAAEQQVAKFVVEYSWNGNHFSPVGEVAAVNTPSNHSYTFEHTAVPEGLAFYRIRQVDKNGAFSYSKVMQLLIKTGAGIVVSPNPAPSVVYVSVPQPESLQSIRLLNAAGQLLRQLQGSEISGNLITIPVQNYPPGTYFLLLQTNKGMEKHSFVKQ